MTIDQESIQTHDAPDSLPAGIALELRGVTSGYGTTEVLRDVDLTVPAGTVTALLGANGAGKTTLLRTATGTIKPMSGEVLLHGEPVTKLNPHKRVERGLCLIPEGRGIFRSMSVRENLQLQSGREATSKERVDTALSVFPALKTRMSHTAGRLSGGQQQMLALCRAYVADPKIVLLDEVSMGLAPVIVDEIFDALRQLAKTGVAMLLVEQYVSRALEMADSVVLLNKGRVEYSGSPKDLDEDSILKGYLGVEFEQ